MNEPVSFAQVLGLFVGTGIGICVGIWLADAVPILWYRWKHRNDPPYKPPEPFDVALCLDDMTERVWPSGELVSDYLKRKRHVRPSGITQD